MAGAIAVFTHPVCLRHDPGSANPETPARLRAILEALRAEPVASGVVWHEAQPAPRRHLERAHTPGYLDQLAALDAAGGGRLDWDTAMNPHSWDAALRAAGAAVAAARSALDGTPAFAAVRPPGHHATRERAMGFCLLGNVAIAALTAVDEWDLDRVLIIDWDVHHGNGTQDIVERDPRIRFISLHQWPLYPGTGRAEERGVGNVFNVPRPPGLPRAAYRDALNEAVDRATEGWSPQLILVSAGFDALAGDPLAGFTLEPEDYATWLDAWRTLGAPVASVLEGGYVPERIAAAAVAHLEALRRHA